MGKGALPDDHPLILGMTGFWGTQFINDKCKAAGMDDYLTKPLDRTKLMSCLERHLGKIGTAVQSDAPAAVAEPCVQAAPVDWK